MAHAVEETLARPTTGSAVWSLSLAMASLTGAELMPVGLLTPMASELGVGEAVAGQTVTASALAAVVASLLVGRLARRLDRRTLLLGLAALSALADLSLSLAGGLVGLLVGRVLLGIAVGGVWTVAAAVVARLVPARDVPRALGIVFGGASLASVAAVPLASALADHAGWRAAGLATAALSIASLSLQALTLPPMPIAPDRPVTAPHQLLGRPGLAAGIAGAVLSFGGHVALFAYLRPFLERTAGLGPSAVSLTLLAIGLGNLAGTTTAARPLARGLRPAVASAAALMAVAGLGLLLFPTLVTVVVALLALWGGAFGLLQVAWSTWLTRAFPDEVEAGGGLLEAAIQSAMMAGAALGGLAVGALGPSAGVAVGAAALLGVVVVAGRVRTEPAI